MPAPTDPVKDTIPIIPDLRELFGEAWIHADRAVHEAQETLSILSRVHSPGTDADKLASLALHLAQATADCTTMLCRAVERTITRQAVERPVAKTGDTCFQAFKK